MRAIMLAGAAMWAVAAEAAVLDVPGQSTEFTAADINLSAPMIDEAPVGLFAGPRLPGFHVQVDTGALNEVQLWEFCRHYDNSYTWLCCSSSSGARLPPSVGRFREHALLRLCRGL